MYPPVTIPSALWESNYYRCQVPCFERFPPETPLSASSATSRWNILPCSRVELSYIASKSRYPPMLTSSFLSSSPSSFS
ncbi:hypothetical protein SCLCIDRAFT_635957 [Scleroderma citrinum Foug A]|uniref:Uncharacterized protein n=1 Tax=Scleroderma citrinum Foug A TaxID=1036808 RepID=A0A0C3D5U7_9AGAM|nr:hypothetical protein SCLCIDRAFT_635957 [Scleroderma citrinum Foug A]